MERLSPPELIILRVEDRGLPMHVAALIIFDGAVRAGLADSGRAGLAGPRDLARPASLLDLDTLRVIVAQRLHLAPRLRQVLYRPGLGLGPPVWVDAAGFDIREHVRARPVPAPGDEAALLRVCAELNQDRLDRSRPLWQMWLLTGLADHRAGLLVRLHHVVADGIAALAMLGALCDPDPGTAAADVPAWAPEAVPSGRELAADQLHRQALAVTGAVRALRRPSAGAARFGVLARQAGQLAADGVAPRTSLNVPVSGHHRLLLVRADLERARAVAHAHGGTVNDVVLTAVAGGARSVLAARGELTPRLVLRASVAASVRAAPDPRATGNRVGIILVPLPVAEADPARRLAQIAAVTAARKRQPPYAGPNTSLLQRPMISMMSRQRMVNLLVSNLPGPASPLCLAGARIREMYQIGIVQGNVTVSVGALSYAGQLNIAVVGDPEAIPDLAVVAAGMADTLEQLGAAVT
ncbi:MAG: wax ester/triacylglycerol synthase family O-acyltransferase [Streptosporangiaceae bacterium]